MYKLHHHMDQRAGHPHTNILVLLTYKILICIIQRKITGSWRLIGRVTTLMCRKEAHAPIFRGVLRS